MKIETINIDNDLRYKIFVIKDGRLYTDRIHNTAVLLDNKININADDGTGNNTGENINTLLDSWYIQIKNSVEEAHSIHGDIEPSIQEWTDNINYLKYSIDQSLN